MIENDWAAAIDTVHEAPQASYFQADWAMKLNRRFCRNASRYSTLAVTRALDNSALLLRSFYRAGALDWSSVSDLAIPPK